MCFFYPKNLDFSLEAKRISTSLWNTNQGTYPTYAAGPSTKPQVSTKCCLHKFSLYQQGHELHQPGKKLKHSTVTAHKLSSWVCPLMVFFVPGSVTAKRQISRSQFPLNVMQMTYIQRSSHGTLLCVWNTQNQTRQTVRGRYGNRTLIIPNNS